MKTLITLALVTLTFATSLFAKSNEKFYTVTDNGKFQYTYWAEEGSANAKAGGKPVTLRTFFLETEKNGLLPFEMTYNEFTNLSIAEKQSILTGSQYIIIAAMESREEIIAETTTATRSVVSPVENVNVTKEGAEEVGTDMNAPWIVKAIIRPGTDNNQPAGMVEITVEDKDELPWVVDLIVNDGKQIEAKYLSEVVKTSKRLSASK